MREVFPRKEAYERVLCHILHGILKDYWAQTTAYQIRYSTSKSFKTYKTKTVSKNSASKTIKNLKAHKKYYVKMRRYKEVDGQKYYSEWSKVKTKKTR